MNRPCFSLGVLLASLAVCLLAVGSANSQTEFDLHSPPCLLCPYSEPSFAYPTLAVTDDLGGVVGLPWSEPTEATPNDDLSSDSNVEVNDADYDLDYDADYHYSDYDDKTPIAPDYDHADYDHADYDHSDYDDSVYGRDYEGDDADAGSETSADLNPDDSEDDDTDYDFSSYDYSEYETDYDYTDADANTGTDAGVNALDEGDFDHLKSEYNYSDYEGFYEAQNTDAPVISVPSSELTPAVNDEYDEFDNYFYEDYFAEAYGNDEEVIEAASGEAPKTEDPVNSNKDVAAFDYFDQDVYGPAEIEHDLSIGDGNSSKSEFKYESNYELIEMIEEAQADDINAQMIDAVELEAEVSADDDVSPGANDAADALYDLRTTYDASYDEAMAPTTEAPLAENRHLGWADHCFGGYSQPYRSEYRCDLADQYQGEAYPAPYVTRVMDAAAGYPWQGFSLEAFVFQGVNELTKLLPFRSASEPETSAKTRISDYVACHIDIADGDATYCEIGYFGPCESTQPVGSGLKSSDNSALELTDPDTPAVDSAAPEVSRTSIRDLRSRMNAARESPPLR